MALTATTIFEIEADAGSSDTLNGGGYDTATTGKLSDLTTTANTGNTSAPVLKSATHNFVAADIGNWVYISTSGGASGWVAGWYKVTAVSSNQATVNATIGAAILSNFTVSTAVGVATTATPTAATASVDYSQVPAVVFNLTGLTTAAANAIILTSAATKAMVGNLIQITGGTNFTTGFYVIQACTAGVSLTVDRTCTTAAGALGTAGIGGALASPGQAGALMVASGNKMFVKAGTYTITSATTNIAGGCVSLPGGSAGSRTMMWGYNSLRPDFGTRPTLVAGSINTFTLVAANVTAATVQNIICDGNSATSSRAFGSTNTSTAYKCKGQNCTNNAFNGFVQTLCEATGCSTQPAFGDGFYYECTAYSNTVTGFNMGTTTRVAINCVSVNNTGSTSDGFLIAAQAVLTNCTAYGNGRDGFRITAGTAQKTLVNCLGAANGVTAAGWNFNGTSSADDDTTLLNCAGYSTSSGNVNTTNLTSTNVSGFVTLTSDPFVNAAGGNFALTPAAIALLAGIPGSFPGLSSTTGYLSIGAVQPTPLPIVAQQKIIASIGTY